MLADTLAALLGLDRISAEADFFDELGASSLLMARFIAALPDGTTAVSMRAIYENRTVRRLAAAIDPAAGAARESGALSAPGVPGARDAAAMPVPAESLPLGVAVGKPRYALCGALQLLVFAGLIGLLRSRSTRVPRWLARRARRPGRRYARLVASAVAPCTASARSRSQLKWLLIGRWKPRADDDPGASAYLRFWLVKTLLVANPLALLCSSAPRCSRSTCGRWAPRSAAAR